jgi:photosystem II stability/assembly factor-like uncharacterized protein
MSKKMCLFLLAFGLFDLGIVQAQWTFEKSPIKNNLNAISLIGNNSGWIVGDKGTILYKNGNGWIYKNLTTENLYSIQMLDKNNGWAVGANGTIIHFDGKNWEQVVSPTSEKLYAVSFKDPDNGIAVGESGTVAIYENGTWELAKKVTRGNLYAVSAKNDLSIIGGGLEGVNIPIMKMVDNSEKTFANSFYPFIEVKSIAQTEQNNVWVVGGRPGEILHFNGDEWEKVEFDNKLPSQNCIFFADENNGISVGYGGTILTYSEKVWTRQNSPVKVKLNGAAISGSKYYAVGDNGTILMRNLTTTNEVIENIFQKKADLIKLFPNPCDDYLNILSSAENDNSTVFISIVNSLGQIIFQKEFNLGNRNSNYHIVTSIFNDGIYLLITNIGGKITTSKFIVRH